VSINLPIVSKFDSKGIRDAQKSLSGFEKTASTFNRILGAGMVAAATAATAAVGGLSFALTKGFGRLQDIENAEFKLRGLGHTAENIEQIMDDALTAVRGTAFGLGEAGTVAASAVAAGVKPGQELAKYLTLTADAAAIAGVPLGEMGAILNKVTTANVAFTMELTQLADRGIPIFQAIADVAGVSASEVRALASEGAIDAAMLAEALENTLGGAAQRMGESLQGAFANTVASISRIGANLLKDVFPRFGEFFNALIEAMEPVEVMAAEAGKAIGDRLNPVFDDLIAALPGLSTFLGSFNATLETLRIRAGSVLAFFQPLIDAFGRGVALLPALIPVVAQVSSVFARLATESLALFVELGTKLLDSVLPILIDALVNLTPPLVELANAMISLFLPVVTTLANIALPILVAILKVVTPVLQFLANIAGATGGSVGTLVLIIFGAVKAFAALRAAIATATAIQTGFAIALAGSTGATFLNTTAQKAGLVVGKLLTGQYILAAGALVTEKVALVASTAATVAKAIATSKATVAFKAFSLALIANPIGLIVAALAAVTAALIWFFTNTEMGKAIIAGAFKFFQAAIDGFAAGFMFVFTEALPGAFTFFKDLLSGLINGMITLFEGFVNGVIGGVNGIIRAFNRLSISVPETAFTPAFTIGFNIPTIPNISLPRVALAEGGIVTGPMNALIGEAGPEAVIPLDKLGKMGNTYNITVNAGVGTNGAQVGEQIVNLIRKYERTSGPVFARA
jgi:tape measure domain-containing protein